MSPVPRRWLRPSFGQAGGAGRLGSLSATLGAGTVVQGLSAMAGFVTLPILIRELGSATFGVLVVVVSMAPWLTIIDGALYPVTRLLVGESRTGDRYSAPRPLLRAAFRLSIRIAVLNLAVMAAGVLLLPLVSLFGSHGVVGRSELIACILVFALPVIFAGPGGVYLGALEGVGRTVVATIFVGIGPILALPLTLVVAWTGGGLVLFCAVQGLAVALPGLCAWIYWHLRPSWDEPDPQRAVARIRLALVAQMALISAAILVQTGLDPVIVSSQLGADAAGTFGLANRLVTGSLIPMAVLTPFFSGNLAAARASGWSTERNRELRHLVMQAGAVGLVVGACVTGLGPPVARWLGGGEVSTPLGLYAAGGTFVFATFLSVPLYLAFSGPQGLARSLRLNIALVIANVGLSLVLVHVLGPSGPLWASALAALGAAGYWCLMWGRHPEWLDEAHVSGDEPAIPGGSVPD